MKMFFLLACLCAVCASKAGNLLDNADFSDLYDKLPTDWKTNIVKYGQDALVVLPGRGVNGENAVRINLAKLVSFGQGGIRLVPGEKYRIGAYVKTRDFTCFRGGIVIVNHLWMNEVGIKSFPKNTDGTWKKLEADIVCMEPAYMSGDYRYGVPIFSFDIFAVRAKGEIEVSSPYLIPLTEKAKHNSVRIHPFKASRNVVPISPLLNEVPAKNAEFEFFWAHDAEAEIRASIQKECGSTLANGRLKDHRGKVVFDELPEGRHTLRVALLETKNQKEIVISEYPVRVVPVVVPSQVKRCNNLVGELFNGPAKDEPFDFALKNAGWVFVSADSGNLKIDGKPLPMEQRGGKQENMSYLTSGRHTLSLDGPPGGTLILRTIPEIFIYAFRVTGKTDYNKGNCNYAFWKQYLLPAVNTLNFDSWWTPNTPAVADAVAALRKTSRKLIGSGGFHAKKWFDPIAMVRDIECDYTANHLEGRTLDELHSSSHFTRLSALTEALWMLQKCPLEIYTWLEWGGPMYDPQYHLDLIAAQSNASYGRGKMLPECYIRTFATMQDQQKELKQYRDAIQQTCSFYPDYPQRMLMISGAYQLPGVILLAPYPQTDPKYSQDMFFNMCANDPLFAGLYGIGVYSIQQSDEENQRWYGALFRHYGIEGKKNMLSGEYAFSLTPGHLKNCDFESGLNDWKVEGRVTTDTIENYGNYQGRTWCWSNKTIGNSVAVLTAEAGKKASISQMATGFVPGKYYSLMYITADRQEAEKQLKASAFSLLSLNLDGAKIVETQMLRQCAEGKAFTPHKVIFKALNPNVRLVFSTLPMESGSREVVLNYLALRPYFTREAEEGGTAR